MTEEVYWYIAEYLLRPIAEADDQEGRVVLPLAAVIKILRLPQGQWCLRALVLPDLVYHLQHSDDTNKILLIKQVIPVTKSRINRAALAFSGRFYTPQRRGDVASCAAKVVSEEEIVAARIGARNVVAQKLSDIAVKGARLTAATCNTVARVTVTRTTAAHTSTARMTAACSAELLVGLSQGRRQ